MENTDFEIEKCEFEIEKYEANLKKFEISLENSDLELQNLSITLLQSIDDVVSGDLFLKFFKRKSKFNLNLKVLRKTSL